MPAGSGASHTGVLDVPFLLEHVAFGIPGHGAEALRTIRNIGEADIGIFRNRDPAFHRQHQTVVLPQPQFVDEEGLNWDQSSLMDDPDLSDLTLE